MKIRVLLIVFCVLLLCTTAGQSEWKLRIHRGETETEYDITDIDSMHVRYKIAPDMVVVPAGTFIMGDGVSWCGTDEREVTLTHDFYLGKYEVTNASFLESLQWAYDNGYVTVSDNSVWDNLDGCTVSLFSMEGSAAEIQFTGGTFYLREALYYMAQEAYPGGYDPAPHPVKMVTWYAAASYCDWLSMRSGLPRAYVHLNAGGWLCNGGDPYGAAGYRLPTDAEWEYAAQYDDERLYPWGPQSPDCSLANFKINYPVYCVVWTAPVGSYLAAPAALGLYDMAGNVAEMVNDFYSCDLGTDPEIDPVGPSGLTLRVIRGGGWDYTGNSLRVAQRNQKGEYNSYMSDGFRIARTVNP